MKTFIALVALATIALLTAGRPKAASNDPFQRFEFATIRWGGRENTHLIRPNSQVEFLGPLLNKVKRPEHADERSFYMAVAMNAIAKEGFEIACMTSDEIVMKRVVGR